MLAARRLHLLLNLLTARDPWWGAAWAPLCRLVARGLERLLHPRERLFGFGRSLVSRPLFDAHGGGDRFAEFMLHMEEVRRMMCPQVMFHIRQKARRFITGRLNHPTVETG
jgi:hypothetical protein